ncbi:hypothetical protein ZWY2020_000722 [Hordeum vulgare]|nr:hypothetical protein ZWY2020_000722 [Hordeum vulgare]
MLPPRASLANPWSSSARLAATTTTSGSSIIHAAGNGPQVHARRDCRAGAGVQEVIKLGAKTILVPGNFPIGCVPVYLSGNKSYTATDYDQFGCLKWFNAFSQMHNQLLKQEISKLKSQNPGVKIIYGNYYGAFMEFIKNPSRNGIDKPLVACCGGNGPSALAMSATRRRSCHQESP